MLHLPLRLFYLLHLIIFKYPKGKNNPFFLQSLIGQEIEKKVIKHGVSSNRDSRIDIGLTADEQQLIFTCDNTNYPKTDSDRSGSGIGLENTRRRLDLIYKDRYTWEQTLEDNIYKVKITIKL